MGVIRLGWRPAARLLAALLLLAWAAGARAQDPVPVKLALIVANAAYAGNDWPALKNPVNDARLLRETLEVAGFEVLRPAVNLRRAELVARLDEFQARAASLPPGSIALLYYSGHAIQVDGTNYIVPLGSRSFLMVENAKGAERERLLSGEFVALNALLDAFAPIRRTQSGVANILILDACRVNPLDGKTRGLGRPKGLADVPNTANTLIAFAAAPGTSAYDGNGDNSPYAQALSRELRERSLPLELLFNRVTSRTLELTDGQQRPDYRVGLSGFFCFEACDAAKTGRVATAPRPGTPGGVGGPAAGLARGPVEQAGPKPPEVAISGGLAITRLPISIEQWAECVAEASCRELKNPEGGPGYPATGVSWDDAADYAAWLSARSADRWRLPTMAEWESALAPARAQPRQPAKRLPRLPAAVGDAQVGYVGRVLEWTADCGDAAGKCDTRIAAGATFDDDFSDLFTRTPFPVGATGRALGFRLVRE